MSKSILFTLLLLFSACEERAKPVIIKSPILQIPIACMQLNTLSAENDLNSRLTELYAFEKECPFVLTLSYKKDIICNSTSNIMSKNMGNFPKSFVKLELRQGMTLLYSYYVDLYSNVDEDDVEEGFMQLKKDILEKNRDKDE